MQREEDSMPYLTGGAITYLMHRHSVTIRVLATRMQISMVRVRYCREHGVVEANSARDWIEAITGTDPGRLEIPTTRKPWRWSSMLCLLLAMSISLSAGVSDAKPSRPPPQQKQVLLPHEELCQMLGRHAYASAKARDRGVPYLQILAIIRRDPSAPGTVAAVMQTAMTDTARLVYDLPTVPPATARQITELNCLASMERLGK